MSDTETPQMGISELHDWVFSELGFCGCGDPEAALEFLKSVLLAIRKRSHENREIEESDAASLERWSRNSDALRELIGMEHNPAMAWFVLYMLDDKGLLERGGNCSGSWLTEKGEQILDALLKFDAEAIIECDDEAGSVLDAEVVG